MSSYKEKHKKYYQSNKDKILEYDKKWNEKNKEKNKKRDKKYYEENKDKIKEYNKQWVEENKDKIKEYNKQWVEENKDKIKEYYLNNRQQILIKMRNYQKKNINKINEYNKKYKQEKRKNDINFRIAEVARSRMCTALKKNLKSKKTEQLLGCSIKQLKQYLESRFDEKMSWDNWGKFGWHIDHIIPCCSFDLSIKSNQIKCFHYLNLQPLWAKENHQKGGRV